MQTKKRGFSSEAAYVLGILTMALGTAMSLSVRDRLETGFTDATPRIGRR